MAEPKSNVYLAGPITGCNHEQVTRWRRELQESLYKLRRDVEFRDPSGWPDWTPWREMLVMRSADVVVANMWKESVGTTIGIMQALDVGKPVVLIDPNYMNSKILTGILDDDPVADIKSAAERLDAILSELRQLTVVKTTGDKEPFARQKLVASIQTACGAAKVPEVMFAQRISARVLKRLREQAEADVIRTTQIKEAILDVLDEMSVPGRNEPEIAECSRAVIDAWRRKEHYKAGDAGIEDLKRELEQAEYDRDRFRDMWSAVAESRKLDREFLAREAPSDPFGKAPRFFSLSEVLDAVARRWPDTLIVLPSARKSAKASPFRDTELAFRMLDELGRCAEQRISARALGGEDQSVDEYFALHSKGFDYARNESKETMDRYGKDRTFVYGGAEIVCPKHLKVGAHDGEERTLRIYFSEDPRTRRVVIGHVGKHLRTYKNDG